MSSFSEPLGRRLPPGARFATVGDLFDLPPADVDRLEYWCPASSTGWAPIGRLTMSGTYGEASLRYAPSGMVVVVREVPT